MMKKPKTSSSCSSMVENEVAEILLELFRISLLSSIPYSWVIKKKRSAIEKTPNLSPMKTHRTGVNSAAVVVGKAPLTTVVNGGASSPASPRSFPATESDDKLKQHSNKKISLKRKRESSLKIIEDLTKTKDSLNQAIENVKQHYDQLKSFNFKLKIRKQELLGNNDPKSESKNPKLGIDQKVQLVASVNTTKSTAENEEQKNQPSQNQHTSSSHQTTSLAVETSSSIELGLNNNGPKPLFDLNLSMEEEMVHVASSQPLDEATIRATASAQARQRRIQICRERKNIPEKVAK